jgi:predicted ester cyclase
MNSTTKNRQFILRYYRAISGIQKDRELLQHFIADSHLIEHLLYFESLFPAFELIPDEITTEGERVIVQGRRKACQTGYSATKKTIEIPFAMGYQVKDDKIIGHWFITDQMELLEQLNWISAM